MITINAAEIPVYPSKYDDDSVAIKTDSYAINGSMERQQYPSKKQVKMKFEAVLPSQYGYFRDLFEVGEVVQFRNDQSVHGLLAFSGAIIDFSASDYRRGGSLLVDLDVTIREI